MKLTRILSITLLAATASMAMAQDAVDVATISETDLRGTARFMSMAGAFGALGGDLSTLYQNPGGIGVYRYSDAGATLGINFHSNRSLTDYKDEVNKCEATCNNAAYVGVFKLDSETCPNINWGFSYNRALTFKRRYVGTWDALSTSMSNYIADETTAGGWTDNDLGNSNYKGNAPWISVMAYNAYLLNVAGKDKVTFSGLMDSKTTGWGEYEVREDGGVNEFNFCFGGNVLNKVYWGISVGIDDIRYTKYSYYGEDLKEAVYQDANGQSRRGGASWGLQNGYVMRGTGWNFKAGLIFKPINELRLGVAFHTPTYYKLSADYDADISYEMADAAKGVEYSPAGYGRFRMNTPWKFMVSAAGVIGQRAIISLDYQCDAYGTMRMDDEAGYAYDDVTRHVKDLYKSAHTVRVGAEVRVTNAFKVRGGYSHTTSPVNEAALDGAMGIYTSGTDLGYTLPKSTQYITCGLGYSFGSVYLDAAYVHRKRDAQYHVFSPSSTGVGPMADIRNTNNQIVLSLGFRF